MKNKTKRQEYSAQSEFIEDLALMRNNAEIYNGPMHPITQIGKDIEQHAIEKLNESEQDIKNFEMLVQEQKANTLAIWTNDDYFNPNFWFHNWH